jgi:glycosyltransferase involved in cell wall biosynthesis
MKKDIFIIDCYKDEVLNFVLALNETTGKSFDIFEKPCNSKRNLKNDIKRYLVYIFYPLKFVFSRKKYDYIVAWQQFFALFFAFYSRLFKLKKVNTVVACNYTYKQKSGLAGKMYATIMRYCMQSDYIDYFHVPSKEYAHNCAEYFNVPIEKFIVANFGIEDEYEQMIRFVREHKAFSLSIGRSNRDFNFLVEAWKKMPSEHRLIIVSDVFKYEGVLPENIKIKNNVSGINQYPYIVNCSTMIIPIDDGQICSGDTVLLKGMSFKKPVVVTAPSTLAEMYITDGENGICVKKDKKDFCDKMTKLLSDDELIKRLGENGRKCFLEKYSRRTLGENIGRAIVKK